MMRTSYLWNDSTDAELRQMWAQRPGLSLVLICEHFNCSPGCIYGRAKILCLPPVGRWGDRRKRGPAANRQAPASRACAEGETKRRRCLRCRKDFASTGRGNQICGTCKQSSAWSDGADMHGLYV